MNQKQRKALQTFCQICLTAGLVLTAATVGQHNDPISPTPLITALTSIETSVRKSPEPKAVKVRDLIQAAQTMSSIDDFNQLPLTRVEREWLESMQNDQFSQGNPFYTMNNVYPIALTLEKGVKSFRRDAYRSPQFMGGLGYDVVKYEVVHTDESKSYVLAYKEKTGPNQLAIGKNDVRPVFSLFMVPHSQGQVYISLFENGRPLTNQILDTETALAQIMARVDQSTALLSSRER